VLYAKLCRIKNMLCYVMLCNSANRLDADEYVRHFFVICRPKAIQIFADMMLIICHSNLCLIDPVNVYAV